ncbi:MAG: MBL fold metallo-hydrolase [Chloroflexi bacterium HGW-Chloroflexi-1]|nr:MAG: MBL fold metallo-hydrolase [Chloroflexi bacterium HGW-Chloroflexi-1]
MILETIIVGALQANCYVCGCARTRQAVVIDPGDNASAIIETLGRHNLSLSRIVATHAHFDHVLAAQSLQEVTGAPFYIHPADRPILAAMRQTTLAWMGYDPGELPQVSGDLTAGDVITIGDLALEVRPTPGHSPGGVTFVDYAGRRAFTGDALFAGSIGRTDLPGGAIETLLAGIRSQILSLPDDYAVLPGHGPASTVGEERRTNSFLMHPSSFEFWR